MPITIAVLSHLSLADAILMTNEGSPCPVVIPKSQTRFGFRVRVSYLNVWNAIHSNSSHKPNVCITQTQKPMSALGSYVAPLTVSKLVVCCHCRFHRSYYRYACFCVFVCLLPAAVSYERFHRYPASRSANIEILNRKPWNTIQPSDAIAQE